MAPAFQTGCPLPWPLIKSPRQVCTNAAVLNCSCLQPQARGSGNLEGSLRKNHFRKTNVGTEGCHTALEHLRVFSVPSALTCSLRVMEGRSWWMEPRMEMAPAVSRHEMTLSCLLDSFAPSLLSALDLLRNPHHPYLHHLFFARVAEQLSASSQLLPRKTKLRVQHRAQGVHNPILI